jgi:hypothetical protein
MYIGCSRGYKPPAMVSHAGFPKRLVVIDIWPRQPPHAPSRGFDGRRSQLSSPLCAEAGKLMSRMEYRASRIDLALYSTWPCECALSRKGEEVNAGLGMGNTRKRWSEDRGITEILESGSGHLSVLQWGITLVLINKQGISARGASQLRAEAIRASIFHPQ